MRSVISRWFMFGLLLGWALTHATVFAQGGKDKAVAPVDKLRAALDKNVTFDYTGQSLSEVLNHFRDKTGIALNVDQVALMQMGLGMDMGNGIPGGVFPGQPMPQVQLKAKDEKAGVVLRKLLDSHQLTYIIFQDALLVTTEASAVSRQMGQRVSINVDAVPFNTAVRDLAKRHGVNLVIDPFVAQKAKANVTLQLEDATLETTVRLLAELAEVKSVRLGNVLFITTEEKAKKIRKEEPNQIDPLNPNGPMPFRGVIGGAVGAFGGVMPMPARIFPPAQPPQGLPPGLVPPPPGIEVQPDRPAPDAPPKKGSTSPAVPQRPQPPQAPPGVERSTDPAIPLPPQKN